MMRITPPSLRYHQQKHRRTTCNQTSEMRTGWIRQVGLGQVLLSLDEKASDILDEELVLCSSARTIQ